MLRIGLMVLGLGLAGSLAANQVVYECQNFVTPNFRQVGGRLVVASWDEHPGSITLHQIGSTVRGFYRSPSPQGSRTERLVFSSRSTSQAEIESMRGSGELDHLAMIAGVDPGQIKGISSWKADDVSISILFGAEGNNLGSLLRAGWLLARCRR